MRLRVEVVDSPSAFSALAEEWNAALARSDSASVFLTHEWLAGSWSFLEPGRRLRILVLRDGSRFAGALPLALETQRWWRFPVRCLVFLTDPVTCNVRSDLLLDADPDEAVAACGEFLWETRAEWDAGVFDSMPAESPVAARYAAFCNSARVQARSLQEHWRLHYLPVEGTWEQYVQRHTRHSREHLRRERAKLDRLGNVTSEFAYEPDSVMAAVETFFALEKASAKHGRSDYTPLDVRLRAYFHAQFRGLAAGGLALVATLRLDDTPIASILAARRRGIIHTLNDVYDPQFGKAHPGHYLRGDIVRHAWQGGYRAVDFNGYGPHLQRWRTVARPCYRAAFYSPSAYAGFLATCKHRVMPLARSILPTAWLPPLAPSKPGERGLGAPE